MVATALVQSKGTVGLIGGQKHQTVIRFKQLVQVHYKALKQVQAYASQLHITPLYLNEIVKEITGFPPVTGYTRRSCWKPNVFCTIQTWM